MCAAMACGAEARRMFCPKHLKKARSLGVSVETVRTAVVAIAKAEGYLVPDPLAKRAVIVDREGDVLSVDYDA